MEIESTSPSSPRGLPAAVGLFHQLHSRALDKSRRIIKALGRGGAAEASGLTHRGSGCFVFSLPLWTDGNTDSWFRTV